MPLSAEQQQWIDAGRPTRAYRLGEGLWQTINAETQGLLYVFELGSLDPLPADADVAQALWARAHVPNAALLSLTEVQQDLVGSTPPPVASSPKDLWRAVVQSVQDLVSICEAENWQPIPPAADIAEILWEQAHDETVAPALPGALDDPDSTGVI